VRSIVRNLEINTDLLNAALKDTDLAATEGECGNADR
jgi:hypothetical protein